MPKKVLNCREISLTHDQMVSLRQTGKLNLVIENDLAARVSTGRNAPKKSTITAAFYFWQVVVLIVEVGSIYLSFTSHWWWFIPGLVLAGMLFKANATGNAENLIDAAMMDPAFYESIRKQNGWLYQIEEADAATYLQGKA
jgi:hypothetical protein